VANDASNGDADYIFGGVLTDGGPGLVLGLTKQGSKTLRLTGANAYTGDTRVEGGTLSMAQPCLADTADVYVLTGARLEPAFTNGSDTIRSLYFNGVAQTPGTWGSSASRARHISDTFFSGPGQLRVTAGPAPTGTLLFMK